MGDRSNIVVQDGDDRIWLYGHWMGCASVHHAAQGLRSDRYDEAQYLAPIIFDRMKRTRRGLGTGFGISAHRYGNEHPVLVIDSVPAWVTGQDRGRADVWFEDDDGRRITPVYARAEFLAIADSIQEWTPAWADPGEHDCAFERFLQGPRAHRCALSPAEGSAERTSARFGDV